MSGIYRRSIVETANLRCDGRGCSERWESDRYERRHGFTEVAAIHSALMAGWAIYRGARTQHTYCPEHRPTRPMRLVHGLPQWIDALSAQTTDQRGE